MVKLTINNKTVEVEKGASILDAAEKLGIEIPTMCFLKKYKPSTSCMLCVVRVQGLNELIPACGAAALDNMHVTTESEEITQARKTALELLLSDHLGDCMGPCQLICPAHMNIPLMIRQIQKGRLRDAIATVKKDIALPAILGRICPAPCEKGCRRKAIDKAVSICLLKRYAADVDLESGNPYLPSCKDSINKSCAIVGAGPAGLSAAYYLQQDGISCTIFDEHEKPGGMVRYAIDKEKMPDEILDKEINTIIKLGAEFLPNTKINSANELTEKYDCVLAATGKAKLADCEGEHVFTISDRAAKQKMAVRAVQEGKITAHKITQYLSGLEVTEPAKPFNSHIGRIREEEIDSFMSLVSKAERNEPAEKGAGLTDEQAVSESARCMHCDCRKADDCKLRELSQRYQARTGSFKSERRNFVQYTEHPNVIYEPGKCIKCGLCIQTAAEAAEPLGLTFIGRGFDVRVGVPFDKTIREALQKTAEKCVKSCPTGALTLRD